MPQVSAKAVLQVCLNERPLTCCTRNGSLKLFRELKKTVSERVQVKAFTCMGLCQQGPALRLILNGKDYLLVEGTVERVENFLELHGL